MAALKPQTMSLIAKSMSLHRSDRKDG